MGEVLRNSVSVAITSNGFASLHHWYSSSSYADTICGISCCGCFFRSSSAVKLTKRQMRVSECTLNTVSMLVNGFGCVRLKPLNMFLGYHMMRASLKVCNSVASVDSRMVYVEEEEENDLVQTEREGFDGVSFGRDLLPPWGNFVFESSSDAEPESDCEPTTVSGNVVSTNENKVHFLEETDEDELSRRILMLSRSNKVRSALELYNSMELVGLRPTVHCCNSLLACLLRNESFVDMFGVFESMKRNGIFTGHTYSLMLKATAIMQGCDAALGLFDKLEQCSREKKILDVIVYNTMIAICAGVNNWVETKRIWKRMKGNGKIGTQVTYNLLVCTFVRSGQNELALDAYHEMLKNGLKPGKDIMQATIGACTKEGKWDLALNVFQNMLNDGLKPNQVACNALVNSLGKAGKVKLAFDVYGIMTNMGYRPDEYTWNALLGALYRANQHADTLKLFERIKGEHSSHLNVHLYNTALMACQKLGLWDRALQLLWQMEALGLSVSTTSYNLVIGACEVARKPKVSMEVYEHMVHQRCPPDTFTRLSLIRSCVWGSLWTEVEEILNEVAPNASLYNAAIHGMSLRGKVESAKELYLRMRKNGLKPDGKTRALMLQNLQRDSKKMNRKR